MEQSKFYQIKNITEQEYTLVGCDGSVITRPILDVDKSASAFTIRDAKDGDVLICKGNIKNSNGIKYERICLFNNLNNAFFTLTKTSNFVEEYDIDVNIDYPDNTVPATNEQKEILFMAMANAGYTFDFKKKELKEIEQKSIDSYCQENCKGFQETGKCFADGECKAKREAEQKPAWSEEDEKIMNGLIDSLTRISLNTRTDSTSPNYTFYKEIDWLKSLRPQSRWKPSDGDIIILEKVIKGELEPKIFQATLQGILEQLKKL